MKWCRLRLDSLHRFYKKILFPNPLGVWREENAVITSGLLCFWGETILRLEDLSAETMLKIPNKVR